MQNKFVRQISEVLGFQTTLPDPAPAQTVELAEVDQVQVQGKELPWVLHIEDDIHFSQALRRRLATHGVVAVRAFDGMEGIRFAFQYPASVIILDYHLPNGRGDYVLRRLKEAPGTAGIPVIVVTGAADKALERRFRAAGADGFLGKPLDMEQLVDELSKHIDLVQPSDPKPLENAGQKEVKPDFATIA